MRDVMFTKEIYIYIYIHIPSEKDPVENIWEKNEGKIWERQWDELTVTFKRGPTGCFTAN